MPYDVGDSAVLAVTVFDADDQPANAGAVAATITLPDGATTSPSVSNTSPGVYQVTYPTVQAGLHWIRWVATGANACTHSDAFDVRPAPATYIVSLADAKSKCNIPAHDTSLDDTLRSYIEAATAVVERHVGETVARRTITQTVTPSSGDLLVLRRTPVIALVSVTSIDGSTTWDPANLHVDGPTGIVRVKAGQYFTGPLDVVTVAGMTQVPANYSRAALIIIEHLWTTERGVSQAGERFTFEDTADMPRGMGYAIPNRALELLGKPPPMVG